MTRYGLPTETRTNSTVASFRCDSIPALRIKHWPLPDYLRGAGGSPARCQAPCRQARLHHEPENSALDSSVMVG
jgi:hypothetical protein